VFDFFSNIQTVVMAGALLLALGCGIYGYIQSSRADEAEAKAFVYKNAHASAEEVIKKLQKSRNAAMQALAERDATLGTLRGELSQLQTQLRETFRNDKTVQDWAMAPVPDNVVRLLDGGVCSATSVGQARNTATSSTGDTNAKSTH